MHAMASTDELHVVRIISVTVYYKASDRSFPSYYVHTKNLLAQYTDYPAILIIHACTTLYCLYCPHFYYYYTQVDLRTQTA